MKNIISSISIILVTVIVNSFITFCLGYINREKGAIIDNSYIIINDKKYHSFSLINYENKMTEKLILSVHNSTKTDSIISSFPISLEDIETNKNPTNNLKLIKISNIPSKKYIQILIPEIINKESDHHLEFININEVGFNVSTDQNISLPIHQLIIEAIISAFVYMIVFGAFYYYISLKIKNLELETKTNINELEKINKKHIELDLYTRKIRLLMISKLSDYSKELSFWRDTIRKICYTQDKKGLDAEEIFKIVTNSLKTYGVKDKGCINDFENLKLMASYLNDQEPKK